MNIIVYFLFLTCFIYKSCVPSITDDLKLDKISDVPKNLTRVTHDEFSDVSEDLITDALKLTLEKCFNSEFIENLFPESINKYWLYTSANPIEGQELKHGDVASVLNSYFDMNKITIFTCHGWLGDQLNDINTNITNAGLSSVIANNLNVIRTDWSGGSKNVYLVASSLVKKVGKDLGKFIDFLITLGLNCDKIIMTGHSLGAHISGIAARSCGCKIAKIFGLDAANPCWTNNPSRLTKTDAGHVVGIHSSQMFGQFEPYAHQDIYMNGGKDMPNCGKDFKCSHSMAGMYFAASLLYPEEFNAKKCNSMSDVENDSCNGAEVSIAGYVNSQSNGYVISQSNVDGEFRLNTFPHYFPYCTPGA